MNMTSRPTLQDIPRQRWLRIIPPILIACIISYMDRVNIAFAMPGGMDEELGISATMAGLAGGIFFIGYLFLQVPGGKIAVHGSGKKFIGWSLVAWAVIDFAVLRGDPSDGLPGVAGIGEKTAASLLAAHGDLTAIAAAAERGEGMTAGVRAKIVAAADYLAVAPRVVEVVRGLPVPSPWGTCSG